MTVRNLPPATQRSYVNAVQKFSRYFGPRIGLLLTMFAPSRFIWSRQDILGIGEPDRLRSQVFLRHTLGQNDVPERIPYARKSRTLPVALSADEVVEFLESV